MATKLDSSSASFLLNFHPDAQKAAESSLCAAEQNKFSEMHDAMFANQQALAVDQLKARTAQLGMNTGQFNTCLDSGKYIATIKSDQKDGSEAGVSGTPSMFINGRLLMGAVPFDEITKVVGDELRRKGVR